MLTLAFSDTAPEVAVLLGFIGADPEHKKYCDILFDEAGHRVATQYLLSAINGDLNPEQLLHYREVGIMLAMLS